ncbi:MAG: plasmid mobilization relaxosome protein MobC [Clostridia bacterium]
MKDKFINFRANEKEKKQLAILAKKAKMSQSEFIRHAVFNKEIVILDGLKPLQTELKRIGNNLNQLTTMANMSKINVVYLEQTKLDLAKIHQSLTEICKTKNENVHIEMEHTDKPDAPVQCISPENKVTPPIKEPIIKIPKIKLFDKLKEEITDDKRWEL